MIERSRVDSRERFSRFKSKTQRIISQRLNSYQVLLSRIFTFVKVILDSSNPDIAKKSPVLRKLNQIEDTLQENEKISTQIKYSFDNLKEKVQRWLREQLFQEKKEQMLNMTIPAKGNFVKLQKKYLIEFPPASIHLTPPPQRNHLLGSPEVVVGPVRRRKSQQNKLKEIQPHPPEQIQIPQISRAVIPNSSALTHCEGKCLICEKGPCFSIHANASHLLCDKCWDQWYNLCDKRLKCCVQMCKFPQMN